MQALRLDTYNTETGTELLSRLLLRQNSLELLDESLFPNGFNGGIVEIDGGCGVGKSQLLMRLIVRCITPKTWKSHDVGGIEVGVLLIDNDHHFSMLRLIGLLECQLKTCLGKVEAATEEEMHEFATHCLGRLSIAKCSESLQLVATLKRLSETSQYNKSGYKVIMIDSLSSFYWEDEMTKIRTPLELRNFYSHLASILQKLVENEGFALFFTRLAFKKSNFKNDEIARNSKMNDKEEYYYLGKDIQRLATWKLGLSRDSKTTAHTTINVTHNSDRWEVKFNILDSGFQLFR